MDIRMPELDGLAATRELLAEGPAGRHVPKVLILTTFDVDDYVYEALAAGASRFLLKDTPRELEVFKLIARGLSNTEIAGELVVSEATVKTHVARILLKLGLRDRVQVVVTAYESGLVRPGGEA
jgi:DNA-binding NarL/FixJ family response regulator